MIEHARSCEHYARVAREQRDGESLLNAAERVFIEDTVASFQFLRDAAHFLGISECQLAYRLTKYDAPRPGRGARGLPKQMYKRVPRPTTAPARAPKARILAGKFSEYMAATAEETA